jgi:hypothetical protein
MEKNEENMSKGTGNLQMLLYMYKICLMIRNFHYLDNVSSSYYVKI